MTNNPRVVLKLQQPKHFSNDADDKTPSTFPSTTTSNATTNAVPKGFLVWGPGCKILDLDPLADDVMRLFHKEHFVPCSAKKPLTTIEQAMQTTTTTTTSSTKSTLENDTVVLRFHRDRIASHLPHYMKYIECCYQSIERSGINEKADNKFK